MLKLLLADFKMIKIIVFIYFYKVIKIKKEKYEDCTSFDGSLKLI